MLALDLSSVLQFVLTAIALIAGSLLLVKKAASKYFVVDASFEAGEGYEARHRMSIGGGDGGDGGVPGTCAVCGKSATKKCSRCKSLWYCSQACQSKHWEADHKLKCKQASSSDKVDIVPSGNGACRRRKSSGFGSISLVPTRGTCKVLQVPKKILFPYDEFVKLFNWDKPGFPPCGLLNCGNSCFANVVLQCLACTRPLIAYLLEKDHSRRCIRKQEDWCFLCELQVHIQRASESRQPFSPINILSRLPNIGGNLGYGSQEDAHEFMRFAIDTMQSVCLDEYGGEKALDPSTQETTLIQHIFGGHLQSQVICTKCNMISNRYENMMDLTVEIHGDAESLEECLDQFTVKEWLDGENMYKCDGCIDYVKAWKRLTVHQAPNILTIALKRFQSGRFGKLNKRVTFPENLDLTPYMSGNGDGTDLYSLYAVVVHVDMLNASFFGHYICYTKDYYGCWYRIDDCKVTMVEVEEVLSQGAYMLLYSRRSARREPFIKPIEPARKKHLALGDTDLSSIPKAANPTSVLASLPSNSCSQSNLSLLRDTGHERQLEIKIDATKGKEKEDVELEVPVDVNSKLVHNDLGDVDMDESDLSSSGMKDFEEGNSSQSSLVLQDVLPVNPMESSFISPATPSSAEAKAVECEESDGIFDAGFHIEEGNGSICISEEVSNLSEYSSEGSFSSKIMVHHMVNDMPETSYSASITSSSAAESETSDDSKPNLEPVMVACYPLGSANGVNQLADISCGSEGTKALASSSENGSRAKPKPLFSRGFLDRPTGERSVDHEKRTQAEKPGVAVVPKVNGYSNGHSELYSDVNVASLELISERGKNACHRSDTSFIARGFLNKPYKKSTDKFKIGQTNCNGSAEMGSGSEASCSREKASTSTNGALCAQKNGCSVYVKDAASILDLENNSNVGSDYQSKPVSGMCAQYEHGRSGKLNGLATEFLE